MHKHEKDNPGHVVHFSVHDAAYWCEHCDWNEMTTIESDFDDFDEDDSSIQHEIPTRASY